MSDLAHQREQILFRSRRVRIRATAKGVRLLQRGRKQRIDYLARHLEVLADQDLEALKKAVEILERLLEQPA